MTKSFKNYPYPLWAWGPISMPRFTPWPPSALPHGDRVESIRGCSVARVVRGAVARIKVANPLRPPSSLLSAAVRAMAHGKEALDWADCGTGVRRGNGPRWSGGLDYRARKPKPRHVSRRAACHRLKDINPKTPSGLHVAAQTHRRPGAWPNIGRHPN